ncbi:uncharacterized protein TNIN_117331 [Trichonephila inaurata madagascariensis]|uniref:Uncharacterized protein n=1 Tax=Trichonephila inaurata madagascariensis TaxID=2747483 RepID=A0A8X7C0S8_9ARAC|nr:uncharacterized protein TNIN_117331 [Trichonephila inaurata madagascariensis]
MMTEACRSASFAMACSTGPEGQMKCVENKDPNGNYAEAGCQSESWSSGESAGVESPGIIPYNKGSREVKELDQEQNKSINDTSKGNPKVYY